MTVFEGPFVTGRLSAISIPATADLLSVIARLEQGAIVLPGLDLDMDQKSWTDVDPSHPQYGMKELLGRLDADRDAVSL